MISNLDINNYRNLKQIELQNLGRVNLFTGKNNSGKSTILEAISLYASGGSIFWIKKLLEGRGEIYKYTDETVNTENNLKLISSIFCDRKIDFSDKGAITISTGPQNLFGEKENQLSIKFVRFIDEEITGKDEVGDESIIGRKRIILKESDLNKYEGFGLGIEFRFKNRSQIISLDRHLFRSRPFLENEFSNFYLINSRENENERNSYLWDKITLTEKEEFIIDALKIIELKIERLSFIGDDNLRRYRYPIVKLKNINGTFPLKSMGDGINRILNIVLALVNADNGFLLIDEFENGFHYTVQEKLWDIIFKISKKLNVQVFATTHSNDCIVSLSNSLEKNDSNGNVFRLTQKNDNLKIIPFTKEEIKEAAKQNINPNYSHY